MIAMSSKLSFARAAPRQHNPTGARRPLHASHSRWLHPRQRPQQILHQQIVHMHSRIPHSSHSSAGDKFLLWNVLECLGVALSEQPQIIDVIQITASAEIGCNTPPCATAFVGKCS